ncbi:MAG: preprotein translocase subunit YajC [Nitrospirales bacterium]|nr:preprotein translocase subunit YajC [Nitrospirales bacterium]
MFFLWNLVSEASAMGPAPQGGQPGGPAGIEGMVTSLLPFVLIIAVFYFLILRPQQKKAKEHRQMMDNLKKGDKVVTGGGIYGVVENVGPNTVVLKIAENVKVKFRKGYIAEIRSASDEE